MQMLIHRDPKAWGPESVLPSCWPFKHGVVFLQGAAAWMPRAAPDGLRSNRVV